ncbi:hypothetical protein P153DRAFT_352571 [Dothidotthia symphoricarpi CBS 119687]|uniref:Zn(2)-C6 fungal-type domain-containing protein n=1 Tax=Dothidotthia symphoricarpi CBS 119687 TaxID=1392245 RepID=A0A6A6AUP9_9PLEO|nr:uncharacterized protein P153DRAFT_352571 [Dothidotthia symphoricarpi CBS 119687]KAF2134597.1 hypothetical protein P153DRAFT_352571 [Dothidotthia symphoricarpi CBS 119687]
MVYTGKPSRGCGMCKSRRIKCDEKRPTCGNCKKSGRACPGYPDEFDLVFRDENKAMARKARKVAAPTSSPPRSSTIGFSSHVFPLSSPRPSFETTPDTSLYQVETPTSQTSSDVEDGQLITFSSYTTPPNYETFQDFLWNIEQALPPTIILAPECEAIPFFFKNFITLPQQAESTRGYLEYLVPLYNRARPSSVLHMATSAVALATCGQYPGRQSLVREAVSTYGRALKKLKVDLADSAKSRSNETVLAVLMFSLYETIMSTDDTITAWGNHVDGAVALTKLRGTDQFSDPMSLAMFRAVRTMMITSCVQRSKPIDTFPGTEGWIEPIGDLNAANRLTLICIDLPNLRARANRLTNTPHNPTQESEAAQILDFAQMVDGNLEEWYRTLPPEWKHHIIGVVSEIPAATEDITLVEKWPGEQHVYHDVPLASIMNDYRVCRIFCRRVIMACVTWLGFGDTGNWDEDGAYGRSVFIIQQMVDDISACVPFHMSYDLQPLAREMGQEQNAAEAFGGYSLVWPLYVAANAETVPQLQRDWLFGRLSFIGTQFGLSSAQVLVLARRHVLTCGPMFP